MISLAVNMKRRLTSPHFPLAVHAFHEGLLILNSESHSSVSGTYAVMMARYSPPGSADHVNLSAGLAGSQYQAAMAARVLRIVLYDLSPQDNTTELLHTDHSIRAGHLSDSVGVLVSIVREAGARKSRFLETTRRKSPRIYRFPARTAHGTGDSAARSRRAPVLSTRRGPGGPPHDATMIQRSEESRV